MKIAYGSGGPASPARKTADTNYDELVTYDDIARIATHFGGIFGQNDKYDDLCDANQDGVINTADLLTARPNLQLPAVNPRIRTVYK